VLKLFLNSFTFCVQCLLLVTTLLNAQMHTSLEAVITSRSVSPEKLAIFSHNVCLSAFKSLRHLLFTWLFNNPTEKDQVPLGPMNEAMAHHQNKKSPVQ